MKYTVIIRQPVSDDIKTKLEQQLVERFGLSKEQAERLASRRTGRLMKHTTRERAELLFKVYESVGAQVSLEELRDEDGSTKAFQAPSEGGALGSKEESARLVGAPANTAAHSPAPLGSDSFAAKPPEQPAKAGDAGALPDWARSAMQEGSLESSLLSTEPVQAPAPKPRRDEWADFASGVTSADPVVATPKSDDWADFSGGLSLPEQQAPAPKKSSNGTEFLTAITEESSSNVIPRTSVLTHIRLGSLLPIGLSGLLTIVLLGLALPKLQENAVQEDLDTLINTVGGAVVTAPKLSYDSYINYAVKSKHVDFIRIESPDGKSVTVTDEKAKNDAVNKQVAEWTKKHNESGKINIMGSSHDVLRAAFSIDESGIISRTSPSKKTANSYIVAVGTPSEHSAESIRATLIMVLVSTLIGLGIAAALASLASRRVMQPLDELVKAADAISMGDLSKPVKASSNDEIGDLASALERMRLSLESAMERLRRRKRN